MIKKILCGFVMVAGLISCTDDYTDWQAPQANQQEEAVETFEMTIEPAITAVNFAENTADSIQLFSSNLLANQTEAFNILISAEGYEATAEIAATSNGKVASADLISAVKGICGAAPIERTLTLAIQSDVTITTENGSIVAEKNVAPFTLKVTLDAPYISTTYYIIGAPSEWSPTCTTLPFTHSGKDVYEDPVFTVMFPVANGETWFAIADDKTVSSNDWSMVFGCAEGNGNNGMEGQLKRRNELTDDGSWKIVVDNDAKFVKMTINMMDCTYKLEKMNFAEWAWMPGDQNGWNHGAAGRLQSPNFDGIYTGYAYLNGGFKMTSQADWNGTNYGWASETALSTDGGAGNLWAEEGFYAVTGDFGALTWTVTPISWGIIGSATPGEWNSDTDMTYDTTNKCLTATIDLKAGEIKFRANDDWAINLGGDINALAQDGANIAVAEAGNYTINLYLERISSDGFYCTITKN